MSRTSNLEFVRDPNLVHSSSCNLPLRTRTQKILPCSPQKNPNNHQIGPLPQTPVNLPSSSLMMCESKSSSHLHLAHKFGSVLGSINAGLQIHPSTSSTSNVLHAHTHLGFRQSAGWGFLSPSHNEQWYCPNVLDFDLLAKFRNKENPSKPHISIHSKTPHPELTLIRFLYRLAHPAQPSITEWSKIVAASVELMADNLYAPPAPITDNDDQLVQGVQPAPRASSGNVLHEFRSVILDVYAAYIIFQTHALSQAPLSQTKKKAKSCNCRNSAQPAAGAITNSPGDSSELAKV
ncbi:uncharacterized protein PGTG_21839 [Puccinia graminis f. sp. tritici CRL 75-36-700-3]|uniref:Uncharacterized protein n=1 Tax=Puccinia graminis f. sp. tritici (strain CRL 75-36-700-3 / race SCCL) TaxID=418459 RepID=H6QSJ6_PUCGT|nr:uncharacterized protein PGTG_21839 [Puccinia graminis f. sp. tritici CRL 75-36-700-3]EHS63747.1 hypothetical protein PGTG_21839 [Puccinia graminis f. sp. tritici CRL 75-36-700-3]